MCVICGIYKLLIYIYIHIREKEEFLFCSVLFCFVLSRELRRARTERTLKSTHRDYILGVGKGRVH